MRLASADMEYNHPNDSQEMVALGSCGDIHPPDKAEVLEVLCRHARKSGDNNSRTADTQKARDYNLGARGQNSQRVTLPILGPLISRDFRSRG